ncbi:FecR domain-containing protein [Chlorogloeopsis sp. ULAP01]|uniref:FecR domain-containing protein n=1 Tax=Chlorogloeopsis sp. ULAP01 TaxID=3056483 RepID=UPI0025AB4D42|nr:FecR domain-containing protein [Chlorogloeopsis sp. ULAP01]MDM9380554.1 FecR domain-containing protein [Chlorogloeopsis sp. ULAP01]
MFRKLFPLMVISFWGILVVPLSERASASTPLTRAVILNLRNWVQLIPYNQSQRPARKLDAMNPGDGLHTGRFSLAELRFNDGSLARVGEQAIFRFIPKTRNFRLSNGTVLLLIPPKKGVTRVNTPNAAAAIRGSALFVRYDEKKDTTVVAALTNSGIEVFNKDATQRQELKAGQLAVIVKGRLQGLFEFDLRNFYDTSDLVRGLDLPQRGAPAPDPAIAKVQVETAAAVSSQLPIVGKGVVENPSFIKLSTTPSSSSNNPKVNENSSANTSQETKKDSSNTTEQQDSHTTNSNKQTTNNTNNSNNNSNNQNSSADNPKNQNSTDTSNSNNQNTTSGTSNSNNQNNNTGTSNSNNQSTSPSTSTTDNSPKQETSPSTSTTDNSPKQETPPSTSTTDNSPKQETPPSTSTTDNSPKQETSPSTSTTDNSPKQETSPSTSTTDNSPKQETPEAQTSNSNAGG